MEPAASPSLSELYRTSIEVEHHDEEHRVLGQYEAISGIDESVIVGVSVGKTLAASAVGEDRRSRVTGASVAYDVRVAEKRAAKRKRGRPPGTNAKTVRKKEDDGEDVCFICFDGGKLVLCDRRGCPKAYHPACIKRDEAFFRSRAQWNCGWHICSICEKASHYMCYTCTYSVCKTCVRSSEILCVRSNMGFCTICMRTVMLMENCDQQAKQMVQVDFDDKSSWEYLFKVYWIYLKDKLSLTIDELIKAWKPCGGVSNASSKGQLQEFDVTSGRDNYAVGNFLNPVYSSSKIKKVNKQPRVVCNAVKSGVGPVMYEGTGWASQDVIEFVAFVKSGDTSPLSPFDVESLLLEYIAKNNLSDPCIKSQVICDQRLRKLFGKSRMDHLEMMKLLEFHFPIKENPNLVNGLHGVFGAIDLDGDTGKRDSQMSVHGDNKHKRHKKGNTSKRQSNLDAHASIDVHNIDLIYLRRSVMESLLEGVSEFSETVLGTIVRIRLSINAQKQVYRLVQVVGIRKVAVPYKVGRRTTDIVLEVLNLDKKEIISIDSISDQLFSEEECWHFGQSIRCGVIKCPTVGEIQKKAKELRKVKTKDVESDTLNLYHRPASEQGHNKDLGECIEKLDLSQSSHEVLDEIPEVHADQTVDLGYDAEEDNKEQGEVGTLTSSSRSCNDSSAASHSRDCNTATNYGLNVHKSSPFYGCGSIDGCSNDHVNGICSIAGSVPFAESIGIEKLWYYEDPHGRMQGPFSIVQLRKWSTTGYFPPDLRIWKDNERRDHSILLTDALNLRLHSRIHTQAESENMCINEDNCCNELNTEGSDPPKQADCGNFTLCGSKVLTTDTHRNCSPCWKGPDNTVYSTQSTREMHTERCDSVSEKEKKEAIELAEITHERQSEEVTSNCCSSSVQHWKPELTSISNSPTCLKLSVTSEPNNAIDFFNLPNPTPSNTTENKLLDLQNAPTQDSNPSWSTVGSATQPPDATAEWSGYSPTPAEPSPEEHCFSISSVSFMKPLNMSNDHAATPNSSIPQLNLTSLCWQAIGAEGSNFAPLAEESVSDLLAEADAMDSPKGLPSPSSILKDDCLDTIEVLSAFNAGKNDTLDSVCELRLFLHSTPNVMLEDLNTSGREAGVAVMDLEGGTGAHKSRLG